MLKVLKVTGRSLLPLYRAGDYVLSSKLPVLLGRLHPGDVVVFRHEIYGTLIKLVERLDRERDEIYVVGLDENSVDSRQFGPIRFQAVTGKVIWHIQRPGE